MSDSDDRSKQFDTGAGTSTILTTEPRKPREWETDATVRDTHTTVRNSVYSRDVVKTPNFPAVKTRVGRELRDQKKRDEEKPSQNRRRGF